jgi:hypothetical protein
MSLPRRVKEIDQIIRTSEIFPRIRDAEREMYENEEKFRKRQEKKKKKREKLLKSDPAINSDILRQQALPHLIIKKNGKSEDQPVADYFNSFVLNRDPSCSKYMPFNEIHFPKLFNTHHIDVANPHSIDMIWMLGFQHEALRKEIPVVKKREFKG